MNGNQNDGRIGPSDIIITHETHSRGMFVPWIVDPHYTARVRIDGQMHRVYGDYDTWDDAYEAAEKYIAEHNDRKSRVELISRAVSMSINRVMQDAVKKGGAE